MAVLLASTVGPAERWSAPLAAAMPDEELRVFPDIGDPDDIEVALFAKQQSGLFPKLTNLKLIIGLQAGVESLLDDPELPADIPIARSTQPDGDRMIAEYVLLHVLRHHRNMPDFLANQTRHVWEKPPVFLARDRRVGFLGMGVIAHPCAVLVRDIGFQTASWTRTPNHLDGVENYHGPEGLEPFLNGCEIVINVLPLTEATEDILNSRTLSMLPKGAKLINIGRGQHIVDDDLIAALDSGHLDHATLDVFRTEPLPEDHPFWDHPKVTVMPHTARLSQPANVAPQVAENIRRFRAGEPLIQPVNRDAGY
jgi:glyoxylate/hydroxypyruvate reductase A